MKTAQNRFMVLSIMARDAARILRREYGNRPTPTAHNQLTSIESVAATLREIAEAPDENGAPSPDVASLIESGHDLAVLASALLVAGTELANCVLDATCINSRRRAAAEAWKELIGEGSSSDADAFPLRGVGPA